MKYEWHTVKSNVLPELGEHVLVIVEAGCKCSHYMQTIMWREPHKSGWCWVPLDESKRIFDKSVGLYWRPLPKMPEGLNEGLH